jgi:hypothetical protein
MGRPLGSKNKNPVPLKERLYSKIFKDESTGCWNMKSSGKFRYPRIQIGNKYMKASRVSYELHHGPITNGLHCLHKCDNTLCINPCHLFLGTHTENMHDMIKKGRAKKDGPKGTRCAQHKLKEFQVIEIIKSLNSGERECDLMRKYKVSQSAIWHIKVNNTWRHIDRKNYEQLN